MNILENYLESFVANNFEPGTIGPAKWNSKTLFLNLKIAGFLGLCISLCLSILLFVVLLIFGASLSVIWYSLVVIVVTLIITLTRGFNDEYLEVPGGHFGLLAVQGSITGSLKEPYILSDGKYRKIISIPFFPEIIEIYEDGKKMKALEYDFKDVKSKDGVSFEGGAGVELFIYDPYKYATMILSIGEEELEKRIREILLRAMNGSFNEKTSGELIAQINSSEELEKNFIRTLEKQDNVVYKEDTINFFTRTKISPKTDDGVFKFRGTGLAGRVYLKTYKPPKELEQEYTKLAQEPLIKKREVIKAEAAALKTKIQAEADSVKTKIDAGAKAEAEAKLAQTRSQIIKDLSEQISSLPAYQNLNPKEIKDMVEASMGAYESETKEHKILDVRGLEEFAHSVEKVFGLFKKNK